MSDTCEGYGPVKIGVEIGPGGEIGLMGALEQVVAQFEGHTPFGGLDPEQVERAVNWLHAKYGSRP